MQGTVHQYFPDRGYGLIATDEGLLIPVTSAELARLRVLDDSARGFREGGRVSFTVQQHLRTGELWAVELRVIISAPVPEAEAA